VSHAGEQDPRKAQRGVRNGAADVGAVEGIVRGWLDQREDNETFTAFQRRLSDDELGVIAGREPAKKRVREEVDA